MYTPPDGVGIKIGLSNRAYSGRSSSFFIISCIDLPMRRSRMLQHYRSKQRRYLQWRSDQEKNGEGPYIPPHLRQLRTEWFAKRYTKYNAGALRGDADATREPEAQNFNEPSSDMEEPEALVDKIWRWLKWSDDEEEQRGRSSSRKEGT